MDSASLLIELQPLAGSFLDRHLASAKEWFPHEFVPWSKGKDFEPGEVWDPSESEVEDPAVRSALFVNLLTEDNLPHYFETIYNIFGHDSEWGQWSMRWAAEEGRHSIVIRDYLTVTRAIDPIALERGRMSQISGGVVPRPPSVVDCLIYVALQELATRIAHQNTGKLLKDPMGYEIMKRVAADENMHFLFYRDMTTAALEVDPSSAMIALERQVREFEMPGTGIPGFMHHAQAIARAGIYDLQIHYDKILQGVVVRQWKADKVEGLSAEAEQARDTLMHHIEHGAKKAAQQARIFERLVEREGREPSD